MFAMKHIAMGNVEPSERVSFLPDGQHLLVVGNAPGRPQRTYLCDLTTGQTRLVTAEGVLGTLNDGVSLIARRQFYPLAGGARAVAREAMARAQEAVAMKIRAKAARI